MRTITSPPAILLSLLFFVLIHYRVEAQRAGYWQQEAAYEMEIEMDVETHRFRGNQQLTYTNHSPDTLKTFYYHLYFNAFQPGSMMDVRSRTIQDPDRRVGGRIQQLDEHEQGYQQIESLSQNGTEVTWEIIDTVMEVQLAEPIMPGSTTVFEMEFDAQVPVQIRRSGRDNEEGIAYSMTQWYPKAAEYDERGWHNHPYVGREFHGVFGTFDVWIHIDSDYRVAATGYLQNPEAIGQGFGTTGDEPAPSADGTLSWHFRTDLQHDFMWAADPDYRHKTAQVPGGPLLRFFYQADPVAENAPEDRQQELLEQWERLPEYTIRAFQYMNEYFGQYPYEEYVVAQGGDGGMEYIMGTLITGNRDFQSLVGVTVHELVHAWYQGVLANNESYYHWMDEGFTVYASWRIMKELFGEELDDSIARDYDNYYRIVKAGIEEPMQRHADHFQRNIAYSIASYSKGAIFLHQLGYIIGRETLDRGMRRFFEEWAFRHPAGRDFIRTMEREAGIQLYWYYDYWVNSVRTIDYGIDAVREANEKTVVHLRRNDEMPMPIDIEVERKDGSVQHHHIPLRMMWGHKENEFPTTPRRVEPAWPWVDPEYKLELEIPLEEIVRIEIDPTRRMADVRRDNQRWESVEPEMKP